MSGLLKRFFSAIVTSTQTLLFCSIAWTAAIPSTQTLGSAGTIQGTVTDSTGAVVSGAAVEIHNPISGYKDSVVTDITGTFAFRNVPYNPYHLSVSAPGFESFQQDINLRSSVPVNVEAKLTVSGSKEVVNVEGGAEDLVEADPMAHTDIDRSLSSKLPSESVSSSLFSTITLASPGLAADSNGLAHPQGEHAETSFSVDGQPISDQQSRIFSNQLSLNSIQSLEVINGVAPAEFGDKVSLVVRTVTRSGLGNKPYGSLSAGYGSFGSSIGSATLGLGNQRFGNFFSVDGVNSGRFLDPPEFQVIHAKGNNENFFDRFDFQPSPTNTFHLNLGAAHSWFQTPNQFDQQTPPQDQRQLIRSFNIAPGYTHLFSPSTLLAANAFVRQDRIGYFPSANPFADTPVTLGQQRRLTNTGLKADLSYVKGVHNFKAGAQWMHTFLSEDFRLGVTDPTFNAVCLGSTGLPITDPTVLDPACTGDGQQPNSAFNPGLLPFDLSRGGRLFSFKGRTDVKQEAFYAQDALTLHDLTLTLGIRGDVYNGLINDGSAQPRIGISYSIKPTNTVLRASYGRMFPTPYNENLILSSATGRGGLATNVFGALASAPLRPGSRNQFNVGLAQALGRRLAVDAEYFWKFTKRDYDFDVLLSTPLAFPIQWRKSKIDGVSARINIPDYHGLTAYMVLGHVRSRFFGPEIGGVIFNSRPSNFVFRIDHDQAFQQTTHLQYEFPVKLAPWISASWRYDSGLVTAAVTSLADALKLTGDQQQQMGFFCGNTFATVANPITTCTAPRFGATRIRIPAPGTANEDKNPPRVNGRNLLDFGAGIDNLFHREHYKTNLRFTVINATNKVALYNVLSTFSGTHFVTPRAYQGQLGFSF